MKLWKTCAVFLLAIFLLSGCGAPNPPPESSADTIVAENSPSKDEAASTESSQAETPSDQPEVSGSFFSPITNESVTEERSHTRPIAVMIPNEVRAVPHYSLAKASVLYEAKVEGSMTRMMAIFEDWTDLKKIGNIRSLRSYFAYWAFEWDSIIVHYGGPYFIYDLLGQEYTENIDGTYDGTSFYRTADRENPHNAYTSGKILQVAMEKKGYDPYYRGLSDEKHFRFSSPEDPNLLTQYGTDAVNANYIDMTEAYPLTRCYFDYNESDGKYYRSQYLSGGTDGPHIDAETGEQLCFDNILVQKVKQEDIGNGYLAMQCHDTTRDGWFFTRGKGIHVTWEKTADYSATRFYDDNGEEISVNTGKTMILIIRDTDTFTYR